MKVLIVGAGAVGQVYALALQQAGATLAFLARPATAARLIWAREHGRLAVFQVSRRRRTDPVTRALLGGPVLRASFFLTALLLPLLVPFDLEKYLRFHYTKTREQSVFLLNLFMKDAINGGVPVANIRDLCQGLLGVG